MVIIGLLGSAITQFKTYHCPRMRRHLGKCPFIQNVDTCVAGRNCKTLCRIIVFFSVVQMAEEYYSSRDYGKALT
jgi:hypothetical protein